MKKLTTEEFVERSNKVHHNKFTYPDPIENISTNILIVCPVHGGFYQTPKNHMNGFGCKECSGKKRYTTDDFIKKSREKHGNKYDYSKAEYMGNKNNITITCPEHGDFEQIAREHWRGSGCALCSSYKRKETNLERYGVENPFQSSEVKDLIKKTNLNKYGSINPKQKHYTEETKKKLTKEWLYEEYVIKGRTGTDIANELNVDGTTIYGYLEKFNIPRDNTYSIQSSQPEEDISLLLSPYTEVIKSDRTIIKPFELDIVLPEKKLAIEYCGLKWHSEPAKDNKYHLYKMELCEKQGYRLITIFEDEWLERENMIKNKLLSLIGVDNRPVVYARKTHIGLVSKKDKKLFYEFNHIQGDGPGSIHYGLSYQKEMVACCSFLFHKKEVILNRYATSCRVVGGFSKILKRFCDDYELNKPLVSFADRRWSDGNLYTKTGWKQIKICKPDYRYVVGRKRLHKFGFRHKSLKNMLENYDPNKTEYENTLNHGIYRIWDCGLIKFELNK